MSGTRLDHQGREECEERVDKGRLRIQDRSRGSAARDSMSCGNMYAVLRVHRDATSDWPTMELH